MMVCLGVSKSIPELDLFGVENLATSPVANAVPQCTHSDTIEAAMKRSQTIEKVALYARVSTKDGRQDTENQLIVLREYAAKQGWEIVEEFVDHERGGTSKRPHFQRMFADARIRRFDLVLFWSLDRLSREGVSGTLGHLEKLTAYGVNYRSFTEQFLDSCGPFSEVVVAIFACIAKQESIRRSERALAGVARARRKGTELGRKRLLRGSPHDRALRLRAQGVSLRGIADELGVSPMTVQRIVAQRSQAEMRRDHGA